MKNIVFVFVIVFVVGCVTHKKQTELDTKLQRTNQMVDEMANQKKDSTSANVSLIGVAQKEKQKLDAIASEMRKKQSQERLLELTKEFNTTAGKIERLKLAFEHTKSEVLNADIYFNSGETALKQGNIKSLNTFINAINNNKDTLTNVFKGEELFLILKVTGYADGVGSKEYNQVLSEKRAKSVCEYVKSGIKDIPVYVLRDTIKGRGKDLPLHLKANYPKEKLDSEDANRRICIVSGCVVPRKLLEE